MHVKRKTDRKKRREYFCTKSISKLTSYPMPGVSLVIPFLSCTTWDIRGRSDLLSWRDILAESVSSWEDSLQCHSFVTTALFGWKMSCSLTTVLPTVKVTEAAKLIRDMPSKNDYPIFLSLPWTSLKCNESLLECLEGYNLRLWKKTKCDVIADETMAIYDVLMMHFCLSSKKAWQMDIKTGKTEKMYEWRDECLKSSYALDFWWCNKTSCSYS